MDKVLLSSKKMDYCTPMNFFIELDKEFNFTLDAAATKASTKCNAYYTPETDGLKSPWNLAGGGCVLQPSIRKGNWEVGPQGIRGGTEWDDHCPAYSSQNGHILLPRLHLQESGNPFFARAATV